MKNTSSVQTQSKCVTPQAGMDLHVQYVWLKLKK